MQLTLLKAKLHNIAVTQADMHYEGSVSIDENFIDEAGFLVHEKVEIYNITNGERFATYVIKAPRGSKEIGLNGAAARKAMVGDRVIICAYAQMDENEAKTHTPNVVIFNADNTIKHS